MTEKHHKGWICLHRQLIEWEWWDDHNTSRLFIYLLVKANHESKKWRGITIERGDVLESMGTMSKSTGLTIKMVRTSILKLKNSKTIFMKNAKSGHDGFLHLSLCNYSLYQDIENTQRAGLGQVKGRFRAGLGHSLNNDNNETIVAVGENFVFNFLSTLDFTDWNTREGYVRIGKAIQNEYRAKGFKLELLDQKFEEMKASKTIIKNPNSFWRKVLTETITNSISEVR